MSSPSKSNKDRLQYAFDIAEKELGIAKLLDPEDVDGEKSNNTVVTNQYETGNTVVETNPTSAIFIKCLF